MPVDIDSHGIREDAVDRTERRDRDRHPAATGARGAGRGPHIAPPARGSREIGGERADESEVRLRRHEEAGCLVGEVVGQARVVDAGRPRGAGQRGGRTGDRGAGGGTAGGGCCGVAAPRGNNGSSRSHQGEQACQRHDAGPARRGEGFVSRWFRTRVGRQAHRHRGAGERVRVGCQELDAARIAVARPSRHGPSVALAGVATGARRVKSPLALAPSGC